MRRWLHNPYHSYHFRLDSPLSVMEAASALAASDKTWLGTGLDRYQLRIRVHELHVVIDPGPDDVTFSSAHERLFRGTLQTSGNGLGALLDGHFVLFWMARLIFFPVPLLGGLGFAAVAVTHRSLVFGLIGVIQLYWATTYVIPRLTPADASRCEAMIRDWLTTLLQGDHQSRVRFDPSEEGATAAPNGPKHGGQSEV